MRCAVVTVGRLGLGPAHTSFARPAQGFATFKRSASTSSIHKFISSANGQDWWARCNQVREWVTPSTLQQNVTSNYKDLELAGQGVYSTEECGDAKTRYDVVNAWQSNYARVTCTSDGKVVGKVEPCTDDGIQKDFHSKRPGSRVLDIGCNTGKNLLRAGKYGGPDTQLWGIDFSQDSVNLAKELCGSDNIFQGDATKDFVTKHGWSDSFDVVQCNFVIQHMEPEQVEGVFANVAKSLRPGGEFLLNFKDAPTDGQLQEMGKQEWAHEVFTANLASAERYLGDGYLHAVMWDDDYYPGVAGTSQPVVGRDLNMLGLHRREFFFYSLEWVKARCAQHGLVIAEVDVLCDSKMPRSAFAWQVVFRKA